MISKDALFDTLLVILDDDDLALSVAQDCHDPAHDPRWCGTCSTREDAINEYREILAKKVEEALTEPKDCDTLSS